MVAWCLDDRKSDHIWMMGDKWGLSRRILEALWLDGDKNRRGIDGCLKFELFGINELIIIRFVG